MRVGHTTANAAAAKQVVKASSGKSKKKADYYRYIAEFKLYVGRCTA